LRCSRPAKDTIVVVLSPGSAAAGHSGGTLLAERRRSRRLWSSRSGFILPDDYCIAFLKVSGDDLGYTAVGETHSNQSRLNLFVRGEYPNGLPLSPRTGAFAAAETLPTLALALPGRRLTPFAPGTLSISARSLPAAPFGVSVTLAALASLAETIAVTVALGFASLTPFLPVKVALSSLCALSPRFTIEVPGTASFAALTEAFAVSLAAIATLTSALAVA